jgi:DDE superfamily endonuclease
MPLSDTILTLMREFQSAFSQPTWCKLQYLIVGTILARGRRTVAAALRQIGLNDEAHFSLYHHVLNRARWNALDLSRRLLQLLVRTFQTCGGTLTFIIDETLERRWGRRIKRRGHYHDPLASSKKRSVASSGLRWIVLTLVVTPPWTRRHWALPIMSVQAPTPEVSKRLDLHHKTITERARQMILIVRRWLPDARITVVGDQSYSCVELAHGCVRAKARLIAPLRMDARLYEPAPPRLPGRSGRPRVKGKRLPKLDWVLASPQTDWQKVRLSWYDQSRRELEVATGTAHWYRLGQEVLPIRWVIVRDPKGRLRPRAYFSTQQADTAREIVAQFIKRWSIEATFEESRAHLGIETQRQWSDLAIERSTPCLFGLYTLVVLMARALYPTGEVPVRTSAWYSKSEATFSDVLAAVRHHLWSAISFEKSASAADYMIISRSDYNRLLQAVCYSH